MLLASGSQDNYIRVWRISSRVDYEKSNGGTVDDDLKLKEDNFTVTSRGMFYS